MHNLNLTAMKLCTDMVVPISCKIDLVTNFSGALQKLGIIVASVQMKFRKESLASTHSQCLPPLYMMCRN